MLRRSEALGDFIPKRILFICGDHGVPAFGRKGASTHLREMMTAVRRKGIEVALVAANIEGDRRPEEDYPVYELYTPSSRLLGQDGRYCVACYKASSVLNKAYEEFKPDAIYERSALYFTAGEKLAKRYNLPRILEVNTLLAEELILRLHFPFLAKRVELGIVKRAPAIAAISQTMIDRLVSKGCDPTWIRVSSMAAAPERFHEECCPRKVREELGWSQDDIVLGYVGSMNIYHKPQWFGDVAEKIIKNNGVKRKVRWLIVGGNQLKIQRLRARFERQSNPEAFHFAGTVPQEHLVTWLKAMDAVVIPGAADQSTPTKIFESGALGIPVIMPSTEPIVELFGSCSELFFKPNDFASFEARVRDFINRPEAYREVAERLREEILTNHTWDKRADTTLQLFRDRFSTEA